jgi:hypothetical protein
LHDPLVSNTETMRRVGCRVVDLLVGHLDDASFHARRPEVIPAAVGSADQRARGGPDRARDLDRDRGAPAMRIALLTAVALALAGCGSSKPAYVSDQTCLAGSGTVIDHGRPPALPFLSPYDPNLGRMPAPASFEHDLELSFASSGKGANDLRLLYFEDDEAAGRSETRIRAHSLIPNRFSRRGIAYAPGAILDRSGAVLLLWSSAPTAAQRAALADCIA